MLVYDLDGNSHNWKVKGQEITIDKRSRSSLHTKARQLLREKFPTYQILEEVPLKTHHNKTLYFDFYLPLRKCAVEVHGQQHYEFSSHFHSTASEFVKQKKNDREKAEWCELNGIELVVFPYNTDDWDNRI